MQLERARVASALLWLIGVIGVIPLLFMAPATVSSGVGFAFSDFALPGHVVAVVYALMFLFGAGLCVYIGRVARIVLTLPALMVALLPALLNLSPLSVSEDITRRLSVIENPWKPAGVNLRTLMDTINQQNRDKLPLEQWENFAWEYAIGRNGGLRTLTFSTWNGGIRALTSPYLRGDYQGREQKFTLGWSFWILGTRDDSDECAEPDQVRHFYMRGDREGVVPTGGNGCRVEGTVYRRRRHIEAPPALQE